MTKPSTKPNATSPQQKTTGAATGSTGPVPKASNNASSKTLYVVGACPVLHDHEVYQPGDELELTEAQAARLVGKVTTTTEQ